MLSLALLMTAASAAFAASVEVEIVDQQGNPVQGAVASFTSPTLQARIHEPRIHLLDQINKRFVPNVIAIRRGDSIRFPNSDDIRHHVYSFSVPRTFELPLYTGEPEHPVQFLEAGMVVVGCNIHDRMQAHIFILDGAEFAVSDASGKAALGNLPDEAMTLSLYHPQATQEIALRVPVTTEELTGGKLRFTIALNTPVEADTSGMTELEKKFHQLRQGH